MPIFGTFVGVGTAPFVSGAGAVSLAAVQVFFSEAMALSGLGLVGNYAIPGLAIETVTIAPDQTSVVLLVSTMDTSTSYTVTANSSLTDLVGNALSGNTASFFTGANASTGGTPEVAGFCPEDNESFRQLTQNVPPIYQPTVNPGVHGLLQAFSQGDCVVRDQTLEIKKQLYVETAELQYLNRLGASVGVQRPSGVGMKDADYRNLIPAMSYLPKQLRVAIKELLRIWYGEAAVRASATAGNAETYALVDGQTLILTSDDHTDFTFYVKSADYRAIGFATAQEVADAVNRQAMNDEIRASSQINPTTLLRHLNLASSIIGPTGSVLITGGTAAAAFAFPSTKQTINSLERPAVLYEINNEEIVVLLPSSPAVVSRHLKGALHFNANASGTIHAGYVFDRRAKYSIAGLTTTTTQAIPKDSVQPNILVNPLPASWPTGPGFFVLDFGHATEEGPIRFLIAPNSGNLVIDPSYVFRNDHAVGSSIHYVRSLLAPVVHPDGTSYAAYVTGLAAARKALEDLIVAATAVGVVVRFLVQAPVYKFSNPALDVNSAV